MNQFHPSDRPDSAGPLPKVIGVAMIAGVVVTTVAMLIIIGPFRIEKSNPVADGPIAALSGVAEAAMGLTEPVPLPPVITVIAADPKWIWIDDSPGDETEAFFNRTIDLPETITRVMIHITCDNGFVLYANGSEIGSGNNWQAGWRFDLPPLVAQGASELDLRVHATNEGGQAGLIAVVELIDESGGATYIETDETWLASRDSEFTDSSAAVIVGKHGDLPWGEIAGLLTDDVDRAFAVLPGFEVDLVYAVPRGQGSWVSMTSDAKGRLITSDQSGGLFRVTPSATGDYHETVALPIDSPVGAAQGLLCLDDDLYVVVSGERAEGPGLYRLRDTDGDDQYDAHELLRTFEGGGEHGPHAVIEGPGGLLYVVGGNHTKIPNPETSVVPRIWQEDQLLPRLWDASGHAVGIMAPGGWIVRTDRDGNSFELVSIGYRNAYDIAFNTDGELFTYDADMEWDMGAPWYRPTRIVHVTSGSEFGWRSGTGKWPPHYPDSLPAMIDIGPGSPTGITFGTGAHFPQRYQRALFACDWTFGTIYAIHIAPDGGTYRATREVFLHGRPLPIADITINPVDGAMYILLGGRGIASAIYRVRWAGDLPAPIEGDSDLTPALARRRSLEELHHANLTPDEIARAWEAMDDRDRFIRFAGRTALEHQSADVVLSLMEANAESTTARQTIEACIALARAGGESFQSKIFSSLEELEWNRLRREDQRDSLRAWSLAFTRGGEPDQPTAQRIRTRFEAVYPTGNAMVDREMCDLLVYLGSPAVIARTIPLMEQMESFDDALLDDALLQRNDSYGSVILKMESNPPQQQQMYYALSLRNAENGWTPELRERYFRWFDAARTTSGGHSFGGFLDRIRNDALAQLSEEERDHYANLDSPGDTNPEAPAAEIPDLPQPAGPGRQWKTREVLGLLAGELRGRDYENGRTMYRAARCADCHRFAGEGRMGGPDLTRVSTRYALRDLVEAIIEPNRTISDQYAQMEFVLDDGSVVLGRVISEDDSTIRVQPTLLAPEFTREIEASRVVSRRQSDISPMLPNALDRMNADEVLDLIAYLLAEGDPRSEVFWE